MATFDTLIDDLASRFGLGANARTLVKEILTMISTSPEGLGGFLDKLKSGGLTSEVASWLGRPDAGPIVAGQVERALGATALSAIAGRLGLAQGVVSTALGYALPKIIGLLTPGGVVPAGVPAEVTRFLAQAPATAAATAQASPRRMNVYPASAQNQSGVTRWLWPVLAALVVVGMLSYFWSTLNRMPSTPPVAQVPEPATPAPTTVAKAPSPPPAPPPAAQPPAPPPPAPTPAPAAPAAEAPAPAPSTEAQATAPPPPAPAPSAETQATAPPPPQPAPSTQAQATAPPAPPPPAGQAPAAPTPRAATAQTPATPAPPAVARAEPTAPTPAATPTRFALSNDNGEVRASGVVRDEDTKTSIVDALNAVFGADKVKSDISVDPERYRRLVAW